MLSQYVLSLLKGNTPKAELKRTMVSSLEEFLAKGKSPSRVCLDLLVGAGTGWAERLWP